MNKVRQLLEEVALCLWVRPAAGRPWAIVNKVGQPERGSLITSTTPPGPPADDGLAEAAFVPPNITAALRAAKPGEHRVTLQEVSGGLEPSWASHGALSV